MQIYFILALVALYVRCSGPSVTHIRSLKEWLSDIIDSEDINIDEEARKVWKLYKLAYDKQYDALEDSMRYWIFRNNLNQIVRHNRLAKNPSNGISYTMGLNQFTDMRQDEIQAQMGLLRYPTEEVYH
ncbi:hypothetical protein ACOME3_004130 [Neoechinorhynchus agilis]